MKIIAVIIGLSILWALIGVDGEAIIHFIRMGVLCMFLFIFLIPFWMFIIKSGKDLIK
jgi:hypothetical protein